MRLTLTASFSDDARGRCRAALRLLGAKMPLDLT